MKVDVSDITRADGLVKELHFQEIPKDGEHPIEGVSVNEPVIFEGTITNIKGLLLLRGITKLNFETCCCRCLKDMTCPQEFYIMENFSNNKEKAAEIDGYHYSGYSLEIDKAVLDNIILNLPVRELCSPECKGICQHCGANMNTDLCDCNKESAELVSD